MEDYDLMRSDATVFINALDLPDSSLAPWPDTTEKKCHLAQVLKDLAGCRS